MRTFAILGDCHGDIRGQYKYLLDWQERTGTKIDIALHVGDLGIYRNYQDWPHYWNGNYTAPIPTWVNPGNHEGWLELTEWMKEPDRMKNLHLLPDGGITDFDGFKVGSIWGNFSPNSYKNPSVIEQVRQYAPHSLKAMHVYRPSVERLKALGAFDMLITHDSGLGDRRQPFRQPSMEIKKQLGYDPYEMASGCVDFNIIRAEAKCKYHFYGHFHSLYQTECSSCNIIGLGCFNFNRESSIYFLEV